MAPRSAPPDPLTPLLLIDPPSMRSKIIPNQLSLLSSLADVLQNKQKHGAIDLRQLMRAFVRCGHAQTRSSATAERQRVSYTHLSRLAR